MNRYCTIKLFGILILLFLLQSCRIFKVSKTTDYKEYTIDEIQSNYTSSQKHFKSISIPRLSLSYRDGDSELALKGNMRAVYDSAMLISVNAGFGIEIARIFLTPTEIQVLDRVNSFYKKLNYMQMEDFLGINAEFWKITGLFFNAFKFNEVFNLADYSINCSKEQIMIYEKSSKLIDGFDEMKVYFRTEDFLIKKIELLDKEKKNFAFIEYSLFEDVGNSVMLPMELKIFVNAKGETKELWIKYSKAEINTLKKIEFSVPSRYL